jgi:putative membrane protein
MEENKTNEQTTAVEKKKTPISFIIDVVKGITLGISAAVPGLSAGTIAVAEKCYDGLIDNITGLKKHFKKSVLWLLPFLLGAIIGAVAALIGIQKGYKAAPFTITGLFGGFIIGSLPVAISELRKGKDNKERVFHILAFLLCLLVAGGLGVITALTNTDLSQFLLERAWFMYILVFVAGFLAAGACIVPGISGSMCMMVIGMYIPVINTYATREGDLSIWGSTDVGFKVTGFILLLILVIGAVAGVVVASKVMKNLLAKHRVSTFYGILGLILGSLVSMFVNSNIYPLYPTLPAWDYIVGSILFVVCAAISFFLIRFTNKKEAQKEQSVTAE